jgi:hypothetical protein
VAQASLLRSVAFGMAVAAAIACGKSDRQSNTAGQPGVAALATAPARALPGALPKAADQMTGDELYDFAHRLQFTGGNERQRRCRGRAECRGSRPSQFTSLRVDAVDTQDSLSAKAIPANGVIAARVVNRGAMRDTVYGAQPGSYEYYLIVFPGADSTAHWRLEEVATSAGARQHRSVATGRFRECGHPFVRGARADFKSCTEAAATVRPAAFGMFQGQEESPIWISCALGCCTADPPDGVG